MCTEQTKKLGHNSRMLSFISTTAATSAHMSIFRPRDDEAIPLAIQPSHEGDQTLYAWKTCRSRRKVSYTGKDGNSNF